MAEREAGVSRVVVIGRGRLGSRVAAGLRRAGAADTRSIPGRADVDLDVLRGAEAVVLAVPDPAIEGVARRIAPALGASHVVLHCAGSRGPEVLAACAERGVSVGVMHPLVAIAGDSSELAGRTFVIAGDRRAVEVAFEIATRLGARPVVASLHGPAYHAAAALVANGSTALASLAVDVLEQLGMARPEAERAVAGLLASVAVNVAGVGVPAALTGPIARGDAGTVAGHRQALAKLDPSALLAYDAVAPAIVEVAARAGLDPRARGAIRRALGAELSARGARGRTRRS